MADEKSNQEKAAEIVAAVEVARTDWPQWRAA